MIRYLYKLIPNFSVPKLDTVWSAVQVPKQVLEECEEFANSDSGRRLGFTKKSQVVNAAIREFLSKFPNLQEYFFNIQSDKFNTILSFKIKEKRITCEICNLQNCKHVVEIYQNPEIKNLIAKRGIKLNTAFYASFFQNIPSLIESSENASNLGDHDDE